MAKSAGTGSESGEAAVDETERASGGLVKSSSCVGGLSDFQLKSLEWLERIVPDKHFVNRIILIIIGSLHFVISTD